MAYVAHIASAIENPEYLEWLVILLQRVALCRDIDYLIIGFDARDPRLTHLRKVFKPREYHSRLYAVHWEDGAALANSLDDRLLLPEVALL